MFTGLIATTGTLLTRETTSGVTRLVVEAPALAQRWQRGDSIAVNGVCLTAIPVEQGGPSQPERFAADLAAETVQRTTLGSLPLGALVNLELPTPAGAPLGGHVVQGHVDGRGKVISLVALSPDPATADWRLTLELPAALASHVIPQGSITVDGISLTVAKVHASDAFGTTRIEIAVIPHTYGFTHLHTLAPGALVNIETDVLAKYAAAQRPKPQTEWLTGSYLMANGY